MFQFLRRFHNDTQGAAVFMMALGIMASMFMALGAFKATEYNTIMTRIKQSQVQALYAIAREGANNVTVTGANQGANWMTANLEQLKRDSTTTYSSEVTAITAGAQISTSFSGSALETVLAGMFETTVKEQKMKASFDASPLEVVFAMDGSKSFANYGDSIKNALEAGIKAIFGGASTSHNAWVSVNFNAAFLNVGTKYAEKLINTDSVAPYYDWETYTSQLSESTFANFKTGMERTFAMLENTYPAYVDNIFQPGAPGYDIDVVCLHRRPLSSYNSAGTSSATPGQISSYIDDIFKRPTSNSDKFDMVQGLPLIVLGRLPKNGELLATMAAQAVLNGSANTLHNNATGYEGVSLGEIAFLTTDLDLNGWGETTRLALENPVIYNDWTQYRLLEYNGVGNKYETSGITVNGSIFTGPPAVISIPGGCPRSPMIVGTQNVDDIIDAADKWATGTSSGGDEALAWSLRALNPDFSGIWDVNDYPADWQSDGGNREKRIVYMGDDDIANSGYAFSGWGGIDVVTPLCVAAQEKGVKFYMIQVTDTDSLDWDAEEMFATCAETDERRFTVSTSLTNFSDIMEDACEQTFHIKIELVDS